MRRRIPLVSVFAIAALSSACRDTIPTDPQAARTSLLRASGVAAADIDGANFCNATPITIPAGPLANGVANPYPSTITVSGGGSILKVTATVQLLSHTFPSDLDLLLVGPTGASVMLMSDAGGSTDIVDVTLTFDDDATASLPARDIVSGSYRPTNAVADDVMPDVQGPYGSALSAFIETSPNGEWRLYAFDDGGGDRGTMLGGWCVNIAQDNAAPNANAGGPYVGNEGAPASFDGTASSDPDDEPIASYSWTFGDGGTGTGPNPEHTYLDNGTYIVTLVVTDGAGASSTPVTTEILVNNVAPVLGAISGLPPAPIAVGTPVTLTANFTDAGIQDTHTGTVTWSVGGTAEAATIDQGAGFGSISASRILTPGVYSVTFTVTDDDGGSGSVSTGLQYIVVYDPDESFVTGGGWINSPAGAYLANASLTGKANFGFVAKYKRDVAAPTGNAVFQFHAGSLRFKTTSYDWLIVVGDRATLAGAGELNGVAGYTFQLTAIDGTPSGGPDRFRIVITGPNGVVYDSGAGAPDGSNVSVLGGGSISIK